MKEPYISWTKDGKKVVGQIDRKKGVVLLPGTVSDYVPGASPGESMTISRESVDGGKYYHVEFEGKEETRCTCGCEDDDGVPCRSCHSGPFA